MKTPLLRLLPLALLGLSGCSTLNKIPTNSCESATFSLNVGPFFSQSATLSGVSKSGGVTHVANFDGKTSYLGVVNTEQTFHDLVVGGTTTITPAP